jgi:kinesin family protein 20
MASKGTARASVRTKAATAKDSGPPTARITRAMATRDNGTARKTPAKTKAKAPAKTTAKVCGNVPEKGHVSEQVKVSHHRDPIMAYLRIRPHLGHDTPSTPYLHPLSTASVRITDPSPHPSSTLPSSSTYTFSHIFPAPTSQSAFFTKTTLPLIKDALNGQNGLLFAYGVTNSGKTYSVQGGSKEGSAGILPRTLDVIFNSIQGLQGDGRVRPYSLPDCCTFNHQHSTFLSASMLLN